MAGGTWTNENKVRPGAYINFKSEAKTSSVVGERGIVTLPLELPWGPEKQVIEIGAGENLSDIIGIDISDSSALLIKEALKRAKTLLIYRLNAGTKATKTLGTLVITAKYSGSKGNNITIVIQNSIDVESSFDVITLFDGKQVDKQTVKTIEELKANSYVVFSGTGALQTTAGTALSGGADGAITNGDYTAYLSAIELYDFNVMSIPTKDSSIKALAAAFIKRLREEEGKKVQVVLENYASADYEGVISVKNGVILADGTVVASDKAVAFVAGATAGANINQSLTYSNYDGAVDVDVRYTSKEIIQALENGEIVFTTNKGRVVIEQDINTLKTFTEEKNKDFRKNRVLRVLDDIANSIKEIYDSNYIGKMSNNGDGRNLFKKDVIKYLETLQGINAVENVVPEDVEILAGTDKDSVLAGVSAQPVDAMEKLYMEVEVE